MSIYNFKLPDIGEGIVAAEIVAWHVALGDWVEEDSPLVDLMTDKATVEMSAPVSGRIAHLMGNIGDQIAIGAVLATFETQEAGEGPDAAGTLSPSPDGVAMDNSAGDLVTGSLVSEPLAQEHANGQEGIGQPGRRRVVASPAVRQRARELGVDLSDLAVGRNARIRHGDLDAFLGYNAQRGFQPAGARRPDESIPVIGLRRRIAENMAASKRHIPHFSYVEEFDVTKLEALREDLNANRGRKDKLTILPLLITAICRTLPEFPMINARYDDEAGIVTRYGTVHLGVATQTDMGLMVPVIRDAQDRNIWQLAEEIRRLADAARGGKALAEELSGSTMTITSLGPLGGIATTPVINRPEVAIVGPNRIVERPVVRDGRIEIAKVMNMSISCDHRVVDGWDAARFVQAVRHLIETPALLFTPKG